MIVRTYGRRSRGIGRSSSDTSLNDDGDDPFSFRDEEPSYPASQDQFPESPHRICNFTFSSQDSTRWTLDSEPYASNSTENSMQLLAPAENSKKVNKLNDGSGRREKKPLLPPTATLMETQEYGEMMECMDEVDFALDGLKKGQGVRIRRASLLSLLNVCGTTQERRLLRAQGLSKTIIDAILDLNLDDSSSNLAAATLFYILTTDGQDGYLLESSSSIRFLLKLLKPMVADAAVDKAPSISQKLLAVRRNLDVSKGVAKRSDSSSTAIIHKVLETLVSCKDLKAGNLEADETPRPELNPDWISLLTIEKACLSTISIEDTSGTVRKTGGNFKETLRELGGLDAVFELAVKFLYTLEGLIECAAPSVRESKNDSSQCLPLLLRCLKIMENATFLSKENQSHLLRLKGIVAGKGSSLSFVKLMINFIKILSDLSTTRTVSVSSSPEMPIHHTNGTVFCPEFLNPEQKVDSNEAFSFWSSQECSSTGRYSSESSLSASSSRQWLSNFQARLLPSNPGATTRSRVGSTSGSCSLMSKSSDGGASSKPKLGFSRRPSDSDDALFMDLEESQDPFAFDEDECEPSKWDAVAGRPLKRRRKHKSKPTFTGADDGCLSLPVLSQDEGLPQPAVNQEEFANHHSSDTSCTTTLDEENSNLVADCLLTVIKVLMNLTNDNAAGCQQIAACGGLEALSSLIARHFPSFGLSSCGEIKENTLFTSAIPELGSQTDLHLSDQELDFLVTILGLLVNMVENDGNNRSRLAGVKVSLPRSGGLSEVQTGMIPLLCSIFLANRGAVETSEDEQSWDAEEMVLQGEKEAEKMIVEAYAALLLAFLSTESKNIRNSIASYLPDRSLKVLVPVLERFVTFHLTLNMISPETHKTVSEVIESCRLP